jgi:hypothetical protein
MRTKIKKLAFLLLILSILGFFTGSCEKLSPHEGLWIGNSVVFDVSSGDVITSFTATFNLDFGSASSTMDLNAQITHGSFSFNFNQDGIQTRISGNFTSNNEVSGEFGTIEYAVNTGGMIFAGSEDGYSWSATKRE